MKIFKSIIILTLLVVFSCSDQDKELVLNTAESIKLTSQEEVSSFIFSDNIKVVEISGDDISDLSALNALTDVDKLIIQNNPKLLNLEGLQNLNSVNVALNISNNRSLGNFDKIKNLNVFGTYLVEKNLFNPKKETLNANYQLLNSISPKMDFYITSIQELNELIEKKYTVINGDLTFANPYQANITISSLIGLESITEIRGRLKFESLKIKDLSGLERLESVSGSLYFEGNSLLENLNGFGSLKLVGDSTTHLGDLFFNNNSKLNSFKGLKSLTTIFGALKLYSNNSLINFEGLESLDEVDKLHLELNEMLVNLEGLSNLKKAIKIFIKENQNLKDFSGLNSLENVSYYSVSSNPSLVDITSLNNSNKSGQGTHDFVIHNNSSLITLSNVTLKFNNAATIRILDNLNLKDLINLDDVSKRDPQLDLGLVIVDNNSSLENLKEFSKLNHTEKIIINNNKSLLTLTGLNNLVHTSNFEITNNESLHSLTGLGNLNSIAWHFNILNNTSLTNYCTLKEASDVLLRINVSGNAYNPTFTQLISDDLCKK